MVFLDGIPGFIPRFPIYRTSKSWRFRFKQARFAWFRVLFAEEQAPDSALLGWRFLYWRLAPNFSEGCMDGSLRVEKGVLGKEGPILNLSMEGSVTPLGTRLPCRIAFLGKLSLRLVTCFFGASANLGIISKQADPKCPVFLSGSVASL